MNRFIIVILAVSAGVICFGPLNRVVKRTRTTMLLKDQLLQADANRLRLTQQEVATMRSAILDKRNRLRLSTRHPEISPQLLALLEGDTMKGPASAWAELREQLGIGWDSSPDYVLVNKRALRQLDYHQLFDGSDLPTREVADVLALSSTEQSGLQSALGHLREIQLSRIVRTEPVGDVVVQYTVPSFEPALEQTMSNSFAETITAAVGPERADLLLPKAWRELKSDLAPDKSETMTIRRTTADGEPDLICEIKRGEDISTYPVRYANYPTFWILNLFQRGWEGLAQREGFELPERFHK